MKRGDLALAAFYAFAIWGNISVDMWMGFDVDLRTTGYSFHQTAGERTSNAQTLLTLLPTTPF